MQESKELYIAIVVENFFSPGDHPVLAWFEQVLGRRGCLEDIGYTYVTDSGNSQSSHYPKTLFLRMYRAAPVAAQLHTLARLTWPESFNFRMAERMQDLELYSYKQFTTST